MDWAEEAAAKMRLDYEAELTQRSRAHAEAIHDHEIAAALRSAYERGRGEAMSEPKPGTAPAAWAREAERIVLDVIQGETWESSDDLSGLIGELERAFGTVYRAGIVEGAERCAVAADEDAKMYGSFALIHLRGVCRRIAAESKEE